MKSFVLSVLLLVLSLSLSGCALLPPTESPWEPVPPGLAATLTARAPTPASQATATLAPHDGLTAQLNETFTLGIGQWATLADAQNTRVFFTSVIEDTRCALDINCYQAGNTRVAITVESDGQLAQFDLSANPADHRRVGAFNGYLVHYENLEPARKMASTPIPPKEYQVKLRMITGSLKVARARLNEPFTLKLGQAIDFEDVPLRLAFEAVPQDSRCPTRAVCATSGTATLTIRVTSGNATVSSPIEVRGKGVPMIVVLDQLVTVTIFANALTPYPQQEFASQEIAPDEYEATLLVTSGVSAATPTPRAMTECSTLSRGDASEILGEALQDSAKKIVLFQPWSKMIVVHSLCGYGSLAFTPNRVVPAGVPNVPSTSMQADYAVLAGKFTDNQRFEQLYSIAGVIEAADPRSDGVLTHKLITQYTAGAWFDDMLGDFPAAAEGAAHLTVKSVDGLGDHALWVWREFDGGRYAALVAQRGETLFVITTLVSDQRTAESLQPTMTAVMQKMMP